jgi:hypothetical protein
MRNDAIPHGIVTAGMQQMSPARTYARASQIPPKSNQVMLSTTRSNPMPP